MAVAQKFIHEGLPGRVIFAAGAIDELAAEIDRIGAKRALVFNGLPDAALADRLVGDLGARLAAIVDGSVQHVPAALAAEAVAQTREAGADCLVAIGGGSATGLAKAVALEESLPIVAVPTTYAGSEMTP